jgi:uncharacterized membrane protein YeiB
LITKGLDMSADSPAAQRGPTALAARAVGPDLSRGAMLLLIALANVHVYQHGHDIGFRGYPVDLSRVDAVIVWLQLSLVDGRAYPLFGLLFGYGLVQLLRRLERAGEPVEAAASLLRRRGSWLLLFGLLHALLLFSGDVLGAYGLLAILLPGVILSSSDRRLLVVAGMWSLLLVALGPLQGFPVPEDTTALLPSMGTTNPLLAAAFRLGEWVGLGLFQAGTVAAAVLVGAWAARRGMLDEPERHVRRLRTGAAVGLLVGAVGAQPLALMAAQWWEDPSLGASLLAAALHTVCGYAAGIGYACLGGLVAVGLRGRRGPVVSALVATGQRSLTCYLAQSVVFVALLPSYGGGLGDELSVAQVSVVAVLTWLGTVVLAAVLSAAGRRGPFEVLLRRLTYSTRGATAGGRLG